jgi:hypothetical protein
MQTSGVLSIGSRDEKRKVFRVPYTEYRFVVLFPHDYNDGLYVILALLNAATHNNNNHPVSQYVATQPPVAVMVHDVHFQSTTL